ncbi:MULTISPECIES: hypothetical protein [Carnobacterium]|uniref:Lipoprotein n=1 Tax=Carnobacterium maltaromaticum TaxID=2751 RepID=A0AAW9JUY7_CARML|nr:hypothetical protein [Carnobacterium maltaromaticum]MDZ5757286.1 hypothetical protein [Carnobacterium maltaromaticum]CAD5902103.1 hypothetical protein CMALT394_420012 [Carnobacterium maltaromaticum]
MKKILKIFLSLICLFLLIIIGSCWSELKGGRVSPKVKVKVEKQIHDLEKDLKLSGKIKIEEIYRAGMPSGLIKAKYTYTENIEGDNISISDYFEFEKDGTVYTNIHKEKPELSRQFISAIQDISFEQKEYLKFKKDMNSMVKNELISKNSDRLMLAQYDIAKYGYLNYEENKTQYNWLEKKSEKNRHSDLEVDKSFYGYYHINPTEMMNHSRYYLNFAVIIPNHNAKYAPIDKEIIEGRYLIKDYLSKINGSNMPEGKYNISFDVVKSVSDIENIQDHGAGNCTYYGFSISEGVITVDEGWGLESTGKIDEVY